MGPSQDLNNALIKAHKRLVATTIYSALVAGTNHGEATLPAAENADKFVGFELYDCALGDFKSVHMAGGIALARAASAIANGDRCQIADNTGAIETVKPPADQLDAGLVVAANAVTLTKKAKSVMSVLVLTGTVSGAFTQIPKGVAPTVTKTYSLSADGLTVNFLAADAVLTASVEYEPIDNRANVVCKALAPAANAGDIIPVLPLHGVTQE